MPTQQSSPDRQQPQTVGTDVLAPRHVLFIILSQIDDRCAAGFGQTGQFTILADELVQPRYDHQPLLDGLAEHGSPMIGNAAAGGCDSDHKLRRVRHVLHVRDNGRGTSQAEQLLGRLAGVRGVEDRDHLGRTISQ